MDGSNGPREVANVSEKTTQTKAPAQPAAAKPEDRGPRPTLVGMVTSAKTAKTLRVQVDYLTRHAKYGKYLRRRTVLAVHDEKGEGRLGDQVEIMECRPMSKTKHWRLVRVVRKAPEGFGVTVAETVIPGLTKAEEPKTPQTPQA
jgi:small subunit ribosomal protein S17